MTAINKNVGALNVRVAALGAQSGMKKAMQRLSSGLRINQAADDAAGLAVATKWKASFAALTWLFVTLTTVFHSFKQPSRDGRNLKHGYSDA